jgi:hypothetical protein
MFRRMHLSRILAYQGKNNTMLKDGSQHTDAGLIIGGWI